MNTREQYTKAYQIIRTNRYSIVKMVKELEAVGLNRQMVSVKNAEASRMNSAKGFSGWTYIEREYKFLKAEMYG